MESYEKLKAQKQAIEEREAEPLATLVAERDRLRAEVAALRAAWPVIPSEVTPRNPGVLSFWRDQWWYGTRPGVGYALEGPYPTRDAAIDAAAGLNKTCKTAEDSTQVLDPPSL